MSASASANDQLLGTHGLAAVTLSASWSDGRAEHEEELHMEHFSVWREADLLPAEISSQIPGMRAGASASTLVAPGDEIAPWDPARQIASIPEQFDAKLHSGLEVKPRRGRFYPQGFFHKVKGIYREAIDPVRITDLNADYMLIDTNHTLSRYMLRIGFRLDQVLPGSDRRGGRCVSPLEQMLRNPGLSAPLADGTPTEFGDDEKGLSRLDPRTDELFYTNKRLVQHLDARALETVNALYRRLIPAKAQVLDLMGSFDSHLQGVPFAGLAVLGMNDEELAVNAQAERRWLHDLNVEPRLPCDDASLDAVVCTASVEYLIRPAEVLSDLLRVLKPGGIAIFTFSNRWFPSKAIRIWSELHEFERVGMVTQWLQQAGFARLHTYSSRGWPRPADDPYVQQVAQSDPVYAVWGQKPG